MTEGFVACQPAELRDFVLGTLAFRDLPVEAERDVVAALDRVPPQSQALFITAAQDARLPAGTALERLAAIWFLNAAVNLADDLADGDCDYLEHRVAPGVAFLLQALALLPASRASLSARCFQDCSIALSRAAAGQSLEVRRTVLNANEYLRIGGLVAGQQFAAYLRLLWDGSDLESQALEVGMLMGSVVIVLTDLQSRDTRFFGMTPADQETVLTACRQALSDLRIRAVGSSVEHFTNLVSPTFEFSTTGA